MILSACPRTIAVFNVKRTHVPLGGASPRGTLDGSNDTTTKPHVGGRVSEITALILRPHLPRA